jgi:hypothetical protein
MRVKIGGERIEPQSAVVVLFAVEIAINGPPDEHLNADSLHN